MIIIRQILSEHGIVADYYYDPKTDKGVFKMYLETDKGMEQTPFDPDSLFVAQLMRKVRKIILG